MVTDSYKRLAKTSEIAALEKIASSLSGLPGVEKVVFFGSRSRGNFKGSSDIDLLVIIAEIKKKNNVISILHDIELEYDVPISPVIFTRKEYEMNKRLKSSFIENVERDGVVLYDIEH